MRISDIVSNMNLATYPQIALVIFLAVFAAVTWRVLRNRHAREYAEAARLPLEDAPSSIHCPSSTSAD